LLPLDVGNIFLIFSFDPKRNCMKILNLSRLAALAMLFIMASCTPEPQACFTVSTSNVNVNEVITFTSCAQDADKIVWNFGDGTTKDGTSLQHAYTKEGTYQVEMKALSKKDKKWDRSTVIVNVVKKQRYLSRVKINSYNISNSAGASWDIAPDPGPDVFIELGVDSSLTKISINPPLNNIQLSQLPVFWDLNATGLIPLSNQNWKLNLIDNDGTILQPASEVMATFVFNPYNTTLVAPDVMRLQLSNYQIDLQFIEF
jgi:hypothetical protein